MIESVPLSRVLKLVSKPKYILGTTYTLSLAFFESTVLPCIDRSKLKSCVVVCDDLGYHNALAEGGALQGAAQDYMVVRAPVAGSFHAKVWIVLGEGELVLLAGSGNLTQAGFMANAELFDVLHFGPERPASEQQNDSIRSFVSGLLAMWPPEDRKHLVCADALKEIESAIGELPVSPGRTADAPRFIHSFAGLIVDQLPSKLAARELYAAAPFFGGSVKGLKLLKARYPSACLHLFPAVHGGTSVDVPLDTVRANWKDTRIAQIAVPSKKAAFSHLKLYGACGDEDPAWICCTSANCTDAALDGPNVEAGLVRFVSGERLKEYFTPGSKTIPGSRLEPFRGTSRGNTFQCWASDTGSGLSISLGSDAEGHLPLKDAELIVRTGSGIATCRRSELFSENATVHLPWVDFDGWQRRRRVAIVLEMRAIDAKGKTVHAECLVENTLLLRADPAHRSAWRGAQALLDSEGVPELADIAALFALAQEVLEGGAGQTPEIHSGEERGKLHPTEEAGYSVAIWPPQPDMHHVHSGLGGKSIGNIRWFQHILNAFLKAGGPTGGSERVDSDEIDEPTPEPKNKPKYETPTTDDNQPAKAAQRDWERAKRDFERFRRRFTEMCPASEDAPKVWPVSVFVFLSTLAVLQSVRKRAADSVSASEAEIVCDDFDRTMFKERKQHSNFCCPAGFRYRGETFPRLADDLFRTFQMSPPPEFAHVLLGLVVDRRMRDSLPAIPTDWHKRQIDLICGSIPRDAELRDASRDVWKRLFRDKDRTHSDAQFDESFNRMCSIPPTAAS